MSGLNKLYFSVSVRETELSREKLDRSDWVTNKAAIKNADLIVLPWHELGESGPVTYPQGTARIFKFLKDAGIGDVNLAVLQQDYNEIAMHGKAWRLPTLLITFVLVPTVVNLFSDRLSDLLPGVEPNDTVHLEIVVERPHSPCVSIKYEGPADRLPETLISESAKCIEEAPHAK